MIEELKAWNEIDHGVKKLHRLNAKKVRKVFTANFQHTRKILYFGVLSFWISTFEECRRFGVKKIPLFKNLLKLIYILNIFVLITAKVEQSSCAKCYSRLQ